MELDEARERAKAAVIEVLSRGRGDRARLHMLMKPENEPLFEAMLDQSVETQLEREQQA